MCYFFSVEQAVLEGIGKVIQPPYSRVKPKDLNFNYSIIGFCAGATNRNSTSTFHDTLFFSLSSLYV